MAGARRTASITYSPHRHEGPRGQDEIADAIRVERAIEDKDAVRGFAETTHAAKPWTRERRVAARIDAQSVGLDHVYVGAMDQAAGERFNSFSLGPG